MMLQAMCTRVKLQKVIASLNTSLYPRNTKQVSNMQARVRQKFRLIHDALYNLHELAYDLDGFLAKITT